VTNKLDYKVEIIKISEEDGGGYLAFVPKLPGCMSDGETPEEALKNVQDAIKCWIETAKEKGRPIPLPEEYREENEYSGKILLRIPKSMHKMLHEMAQEEGVSLNNLIQNLLSFAVGYKKSSRESFRSFTSLLVGKTAEVNMNKLNRSIWNPVPLERLGFIEKGQQYTLKM
jgi:predicted RNase H-like HicB family nuclease